MPTMLACMLFCDVPQVVLDAPKLGLKLVANSLPSDPDRGSLIIGEIDRVRLVMCQRIGRGCAIDGFYTTRRLAYRVRTMDQFGHEVDEPSLFGSVEALE